MEWYLHRLKSYEFGLILQSWPWVSVTQLIDTITTSGKNEDESRKQGDDKCLEPWRMVQAASGKVETMVDK